MLRRSRNLIACEEPRVQDKMSQICVTPLRAGTRKREREREREGVRVSMSKALKGGITHLQRSMVEVMQEDRETDGH